jgi:DNA polymerase-1
MVKLDRMMEAAKCKSILILQVHDEIVVDAHPDEVEMMAEMVKEAMTNPTDEEIYLPLVVDLVISNSLSKG